MTKPIGNHAPAPRGRPGPRRRARLGLIGALAGLSAATATEAQTFIYGRTMVNDVKPCTAGKGPAVLVEISGLKSANGNLFVRLYRGRSEDWLKSKRYLLRVDATPRQGSILACVPLPAPGEYAIAIHHDENGNRITDLSPDGAGLSNNPKIKTFLGIPLPPSVDRTRFTAGNGITRMAIRILYRG